MVRKIFLMVLIVLSVNKIIAQEKINQSQPEQRQVQKTIGFAPNEKIVTYNSTGKYLSVITSDENSNSSNYYIYDLKGNEIRSGKNREASLQMVSTIEKLNMYVTIERTLVEDQDDKITAYNLINGSRIWQTTGRAFFYEISPDSLHLMTRNYCDVCKGSIFTVFDLMTGEQIQSRNNIQYFRAKWLTNDKILLLFHRKVLNPEFKLLKNPYQEKRTELWRRKNRIESDYRFKQISQTELKRKLDSLEVEKKNNLEEEKKWLSLPIDPNRIQKPQYNYSTARLAIYNITTGIIEDSTDIFESNGYKVTVPFGEVSVGNIDNDISGFFIYLYKSNDAPTIFKFNNQLQKLWEANLPAEKLVKIKENGIITYGIVKDNYIIRRIDSNNGILIQDNEQVALANYDIKNNSYVKKENQIFDINKPQNKIQIFRGETK